jgi:DNA uptake protein ComE-like DNA-binding protein
MLSAFLLRSSVSVCALILILSAQATAQTQLPEGKGRDIVLKVCGGCHEASQAAALRLTRDGWNDLISNMRGEGAEATEAEFAEILNYFSTNFPADAAPNRLNINIATQVELESIAGLLRSQAAAVLKFIEKTPCKDLNDLKKVQGIDFKKIEEHKDLLVCGPPRKDDKPR